MSYRPALIGRAAAQFSDLMRDKAIYDALMERIIQLADGPWDAWPVYPGGDEPEFHAPPIPGILREIRWWPPIRDRLVRNGHQCSSVNVRPR